jgi:hypothetical protein
MIDLDAIGAKPQTMAYGKPASSAAKAKSPGKPGAKGDAGP